MRAPRAAARVEPTNTPILAIADSGPWGKAWGAPQDREVTPTPERASPADEAAQRNILGCDGDVRFDPKPGRQANAEGFADHQPKDDAQKDRPDRGRGKIHAQIDSG